MDEKVLIKSVKTNKRFLLIIGAIVSLILGIVYEAVFWEFDRVTWVWIVEIAYIAVPAFLLFFFFPSLTVNKCELTITDKRVYGTVIFGKRVDLPLDSVSAVGTSAFHGITIATSSGRISFIGIKNRNEIHEVVSKLLVERQNQAHKSAATVVNAPAASNADELKKFKELLDAGIITQEEFDAKKKQLLGL